LFKLPLAARARRVPLFGRSNKKKLERKSRNAGPEQNAVTGEKNLTAFSST